MSLTVLHHRLGHWLCERRANRAREPGLALKQDCWLPAASPTSVSRAAWPGQEGRHKGLRAATQFLSEEPPHPYWRWRSVKTKGICKLPRPCSCWPHDSQFHGETAWTAPLICSTPSRTLQDSEPVSMGWAPPFVGCTPRRLLSQGSTSTTHWLLAPQPWRKANMLSAGLPQPLLPACLSLPKVLSILTTFPKFTNLVLFWLIFSSPKAEPHLHSLLDQFSAHKKKYVLYRRSAAKDTDKETDLD